MQLPLHGHKILLYKSPVDFRQGVNGLSSVITQTASGDLTEDIYVFYNKARDKLKILTWHKNGFLLIYKRFERMKVKVVLKQADGCCSISEEEFGWLLAGLDWQAMTDWGHLNYDKFT
jgi:transposase